MIERGHKMERKKRASKERRVERKNGLS